MAQSFHEDCLDLARRALSRGATGRRGALKALAAMGAAVAGGAQAQGSRELVIVNWGGVANEGFARNYGAPFEAANPGFKVVQNSTGPSAGRIKSMVDSGSVTWDLCDSSASASRVLSKQNLIARGMVPFVQDNRIHVVPPCVVTDDEAAAGLAIYDEVLGLVDTSKDES